MKLLTNKWLLLIFGLILWTAVGIALFAGRENVATSGPDTSGVPERIVCTTPNLAEIVFALGIGGRLVGVPDSCKHPAEVADVPKIGSFWTPSIEPIIARQPDLIITLNFPQQKQLAARLDRLRYATLAVSIETIEEFYSAVNRIGQATDTQPQAEKLTEGLKTRIEDFAKRMTTETNPKVLWVVQRNPLRVAGTDTFINDLVELAGGTNAIGKTDYQYPPIGSEQVYSLSPDVIIEPAMDGGDLDAQYAEAVKYWSKFDIPAVTDRHIYVIEADSVSQLGPRLFEGLEAVGRCVKPELFENTKSTEDE